MPSKNRLHLVVSVTLLLLGALAGPAAAAATATTDLGPTANTAIKRISLSLKLHDTARLDALIEATTTPGSARYHQFLSVAEFSDQFAPSNAEVAAVVSGLEANGLHVDAIHDNQIDT